MFIKKTLCYDYCKSNILETVKFNSKKYGYNSLRYNGSVWWNKLDNAICQLESVKEFKTRIKEWSIRRCMCGHCITCKITPKKSPRHHLIHFSCKYSHRVDK